MHTYTLMDSHAQRAPNAAESERAEERVARESYTKALLESGYHCWIGASIGGGGCKHVCDCKQRDNLWQVEGYLAKRSALIRFMTPTHWFSDAEKGHRRKGTKRWYRKRCWLFMYCNTNGFACDICCKIHICMYVYTFVCVNICTYMNWVRSCSFA